jgi:hypothetical protein
MERAQGGADAHHQWLGNHFPPVATMYSKGRGSKHLHWVHATSVSIQVGATKAPHGGAEPSPRRLLDLIGY